MIVNRFNLKELGEMLCEQRQRRGLKQTQMARDINYNHPGISKIESGMLIPRLDLLIDMCDRLGLEIEVREVIK